MTYKEKARKARKKVLTMVHAAQTSHIGSCFSSIDILTVLFDKLNIDKRMKEDRDRFVLSKGWVAASLYYFLSEKGIIPKKDLATFCKGDSKYIGLAEPNVRGVEFAGGSMGMGLPAGVGFALAKKLKAEKGRVVVLESDGGMNCGMVWESLAIAAHHKLDNLTLIIDANGFQAMGTPKEVLNFEPMDRKLRAFGWVVTEIDGHNYKEIEKALSVEARNKPHVILARTVKGKGVKKFEGDNLWHYWHVDKPTYKQAMKDLCSTKG